MPKTPPPTGDLQRISLGYPRGGVLHAPRRRRGRQRRYEVGIGYISVLGFVIFSETRSRIGQGAGKQECVRCDDRCAMVRGCGEGRASR
eukprot:scaffold91411_cov54-Phaeocystis_antarctica.AAC.3